MNYIPPTGADHSPYDIRTFSAPVEAVYRQSGGQRYLPEDIEHQRKVGICTAISLTQNARKATGKKWSADFQYLIQKKYYDRNWDEGSSIFHALRAAKGIGLLPAEEFTKWVKETDRSLPYHEYIKKLQAVPEKELARLILIANKNKIAAYGYIDPTRDAMAQAIDNSRAGILTRYNLGAEWYTDQYGNVTWNKRFIEPLRPPKKIISGHAVTDSNYNGDTFRVANTWSKDWADGGTAYRLQKQYTPTEAWAIYYTDKAVPEEIKTQLENRAKTSGKMLDFLQKIIVFLRQFKP